jgi:hypothetical protein
VNHENELREFARRARQVAELIQQDGQPCDQFQSKVKRYLPNKGPDAKLQQIERDLYKVADSIDGYLKSPAG